VKGLTTQFTGRSGQLVAGARTSWPFPMNAFRRGDEFVVCFDPPGMGPGAIDLTVDL
jgi:HSP20 family protein